MNKVMRRIVSASMFIPVIAVVPILYNAAPVTLGVAGMAAVTDQGPDCGGVILTDAGGNTRPCTFDDEFDGTALNPENWSVQETASSGFHAGPECFVDDPDNVSVSEGTLKLTVRKVPAFVCKSPRGSYYTQATSGMVSTYDKFGQAYGHFDIRAKFSATAIRGLQSALWLWPTNSAKYGPAWPMSGEIDVAEVYSQYPDRAIPTIHYVINPLSVNTRTNTNIFTNYHCMIDDLSAFHDYVLDWTPTTMTVSYDDDVCLVDRYQALLPMGPSKPFDQPFMVALTQALGTGANAVNPYNAPVPATTEVDYVRVWQ